MPVPYEIQSVEEIPRGASICIYGSGAMGLQLLDRIRSLRGDVRVDGFLDSFGSGRTSNGMQQLSLEDYARSGLRHDAILVASAYRDEMVRNLEAHGMRNYAVYAPKREHDESVYRIAIGIEALISQNKMAFLEEGRSIGRGEHVALLNLESVGESRDFSFSDAVRRSVFEKNDVEYDVGFSRYAEGLLRDLLGPVRAGRVDRVYVNANSGDMRAAVAFAEAYCALDDVPPLTLVRRRSSHSWRGIRIPGTDVFYLSIPKCGSTSLLHSIRSAYEEGYAGSGRSPHGAEQRGAILQTYFFKDPASFRGTVFTIVRDPLSRLASLYNSYVNGGKYLFLVYLERYWGRGPISFEAFVDFVRHCPDSVAEQHFRSQASYVSDPQGNRFVHRLFRLEWIKEEIGAINALLPKPIELLHRNRSSGRDVDYFSTYYRDEQVARAVAQRYARDVELLREG